MQNPHGFSVPLHFDEYVLWFLNSFPRTGPGLVKRGGLDGKVLNSLKGMWLMTDLLFSSKIQGSLSFIQGRNLSSNMIFFGQLCFPPPISSKLSDLL